MTTETILSSAESIKSTTSTSSGPVIRVAIATEIVPGLFIGTKIAALDKNFLIKHGVTHVINMAWELPTPFDDIVEYVHVPLADNTKANLLQKLDSLLDLIDKVLETREKIRLERADQRSIINEDSDSDTAPAPLPVVMVHCAQGVSRSAAVVIAWRMRKFEETYEQALAFIRKRRAIVTPNEGFKEQLELFEKWGWKTKGIGYTGWKVVRWGFYNQQYSNYSNPYGNYGSYNSYSSPYNRFGSTYGGYNSYNRFGNTYGGLGGYNNYSYNNSYNRPYGSTHSYNGQQPNLGPNPEMSLTAQMEQSTQSTFQTLDQVVQAFGGFAQMLESTFFATHSSFMAMIGVAEQFGNLKNYLSQLFSVFAVYKAGKEFIERSILGRRANPADLNAKAFEDFTARSNTPGKSSKPVWIFLFFAVGLPWLISKLIKRLQQQRLQNGEMNVTPEHSGAASIQNIKDLEFCRAMYDFVPENISELELRRGDIVAILTKLDPMGQPSDWWKGRLQSGKIGWFPSTYVEILEKKTNPASTENQ
ncbi:Peroxisomal membrane protein PAS20 [Nowakowskiella sp. JEL0407]|nr:Peroxisomal membrane protein PAS20 [Nowakowskiella sp. JEL0407]